MSHPPLRSLLAEALSLPEASLNENACMENMAEWDSFAHLHFMMSLEKYYGIRLNDTSISACRSLKGAQEYVGAHGR